jgi:chromosome segregation ATPase
LEALKEKFATLVKQDRNWRHRVHTATRVAQDERIQRQLIEMELDKANAIKHRLESLCRDLHNENRRIKAEGARRDELAAITAAAATGVRPAEHNVEIKMEFLLPALPEKEILEKETSVTLSDRIGALTELYNSREEHFGTQLRQREVDVLCTTEKADLLATQLAKQTTTLENSTRRISALTRSEQELKAQVRQYVDKFRQVEETLGKSNDLFGTFRAEMETMGGKLARLERENAQLNSKCATLSRNIIEMADERTKQNAALETLRGQKAKLEQLCRTLAMIHHNDPVI